MYRTIAFKNLREKLAAENLQAVIIPTNDPHFGEYTQDYYKVREWLSGFNGSAGTLVVTLGSAALWTDSRYFVQAEAQLAGTGVELMKLKMPGTPTIEAWLKSQLQDQGLMKSQLQDQGLMKSQLAESGAAPRVAIDEAIFSYSEFMALKGNLAPECEVVPVKDLFVDIWTDRKPLEFKPVFQLPGGFTGEDTTSKYAGVIEKLAGCAASGKFAYVVTACDDVAWLCNIRGNDIEYNPVAQSYAVVTEECIHLFVAVDKLEREAKEYLVEQDVVLHQYDEFEQFLKQLGPDVLRICSKSKISVRDYKALCAAGHIDVACGTADSACGTADSACVDVRFADDPVLGGTINRMKAVKNEVECEGFRRAYLYDGVAWCKLLKYIDDSLKNGTSLSEYEIGEKLIEFRSENLEYRGESFEPIVAYGPNGALPHYSATKENCSIVPAGGSAACSGKADGNFLLMDTGGQYLFGTTDTTRTIPVGDLDEDKKKFYTLVLKGMISLSMAKFPAGTRGASLDILARGPLFNEGVMYYHGTGHGIGHYLCVHEGPQSIRMEENPVTLEQGMVMSNEPAIYFAGKYGIRTENVILVQPWKKTEFNQFYEFETFTLVPIATSCVLPQLLTAQEIEWLNNYNAKVFEKISPLLDDEAVKQWLANATAAI